MRRFNAYLRAMSSRKPEWLSIIPSKINVLHLAPGERVPDDVSNKGWFFVEEGFLLLLRKQGERWVCKDFYWEGMASIAITPEDKPLEHYVVEASEPSVVYYLTKEEQRELWKEKWGWSFDHCRSIIAIRSNHRSEERHEVLERTKISDRIAVVDKQFTVLYRAPTQRLAEYLGLDEGAAVLLEMSKQKWSLAGGTPVDLWRGRRIRNWRLAAERLN